MNAKCEMTCSKFAVICFSIFQDIGNSRSGIPPEDPRQQGDCEERLRGIREVRSLSSVLPCLLGSIFHRISRMLWVFHGQLLRSAAPVTVVEFRDAPSSHAVNGELAETLDQFALPFPTQKNSLLVDNVDLQIGIHNLRHRLINSAWITEGNSI